jgi:hypothetical protein
MHDWPLHPPPSAQHVILELVRFSPNRRERRRGIYPFHAPHGHIVPSRQFCLANARAVASHVLHQPLSRHFCQGAYVDECGLGCHRNFEQQHHYQRARATGIIYETMRLGVASLPTPPERAWTKMVSKCHGLEGDVHKEESFAAIPPPNERKLVDRMDGSRTLYALHRIAAGLESSAPVMILPTQQGGLQANDPSSSAN